MNNDKIHKEEQQVSAPTAKSKEALKNIVEDYALDIILEYFSIVDLELGGDNDSNYLDIKLRVSEEEIPSHISSSQEKLKHTIKIWLSFLDPDKVLKNHL